MAIVIGEGVEEGWWCGLDDVEVISDSGTVSCTTTNKQTSKHEKDTKREMTKEDH